MGESSMADENSISRRDFVRTAAGTVGTVSVHALSHAGPRHASVERLDDPVSGLLP